MPAFPELPLWAYPVLFVIGLVTGTVDAIAGGGGLITLPALLGFGLPAPFALGTAKLQGVFGTGSATWSYARRGAVDLAEDTLLRSAVHWQVIVLGEAARRVSRELRESTPVVDWPLLFIQRNFYAHEYDRATPGELHVVLSQLPGLAVALDELLARRPPPIEPPNLR